jgi:predicted protein tyrosine phosphatase
MKFEKRIVIKNAENIQGYVEQLHDDFILISITNPWSMHVRIPANQHCKGILRLRFHDTVQKHLGKIHFRQRHARRVKRFVSRHDTDLIVCQCRAGISRSAGIGAALAKYYHLDVERFFTTGGYVPNLLVFRTVLEAFGIGIGDDEINRYRRQFINRFREKAGLEPF